MNPTSKSINVWHVGGTRLTPGSLVRMPDKSVWAVHSVSVSRARVYPLTPKTRTIIVRDARHPTKGKVEKEVNETGDPLDISPNSVLPSVEVADLTDAEFDRLTSYISSGGEFNG